MTGSFRRLGILAAALSGVLVGASGLVFAVPGNGEFFVVASCAGFAAAYLAPGWPGYIAVVLGATATSAVIGAGNNAFWGPYLAVLVVGMVTPFAGLGELLAIVWRKLPRHGILVHGANAIGIAIAIAYGAAIAPWPLFVASRRARSDRRPPGAADDLRSWRRRAP
jgi:hypothetical protein